MKNQKSFTVIELLVVIAIIGLLASILLVIFKEPREKARIAKTLQFSSSIQHLLGIDMVGGWRFEDGEGGSDFCWMVYRTINTQRLRPHIRTTTGIYHLDTATTLTANKWYHVVETTDDSQMRIYINAIEDTNSPKTFSGTLVNQIIGYSLVRIYES